MTAADAIKQKKKQILTLVKRYLKAQSPSGYSLVVPDDNVMLVSDGLAKHHERWYVQVVPEPEFIADTRKQEYLRILSDIEEILQKKHKLTVYLTSMLPVL